MFITHKTLQSDQITTQCAPLYDFTSRISHIVVAQGCFIKTFAISQNSKNSRKLILDKTIPFMSPVEVCASIDKNSPSLFILLRNMNWFIINNLKIAKHGSLYNPNLYPPERSLLPRNSELMEPPAASSPTATATIRFSEKRILYRLHPKFIALHLQHDVIHVIKINCDNDDENGEIITIPLLYTNLVDMTFMGPTSCSTRLAFIANNKSDGIILCAYTLNQKQTDFVLDFTVDLPNDAHSLLALKPEIESSLVVFTRDGIIRITSLEGLSHTVEHLSSYIPPYILHHCYFYDDIYLICDACGGLSGVSLPIEGSIAIGSITNVGPTSGIIVIDKNYFFVSSPFGDSYLYEFRLMENCFELNVCDVVKGNALISNLQLYDDDIYCSSGRGNSCSISKFENLVPTQALFKINVGSCFETFSFGYKDDILICLCYFDETRIIKFMKKNNNVEIIDWKTIDSNDNTLQFKRINKQEILYVSSSYVKILNIKNGCMIREKQLSNTIKSISNDNFIILANDSCKVMIIDFDFEQYDLIKLDKEILLIACNNNYLVIHLIDNEIILYDINKKCKIQQNKFDFLFVHSSIIIDNDNNIILGTENGLLITLTNKLEIAKIDKYGENRIILNNVNEDMIIGSGDLPFSLSKADGIVTYGSCKCECIQKINDILICLQNDSLLIAKTSSFIQGTTVMIKSIPGLLNFVKLNTSELIALIENNDNEQYIIKYINDKEDVKYKLKSHLSLFQHVKHGNNNLIIIGYQENPLIEIINEDLLCISSQEISGIPTSATISDSYLIISKEGGMIDFFSIVNLDGFYELERKYICESHIISPCLLIHNDFLISSDVYQSLFVFKISEKGVIKVSEDTSPKGINKIVFFDSKLFACDFKGSIYCYNFDEKEGKITEIGSFQLSSKVLSLLVHQNKLYYSTEGGGFGIFVSTNDANLPIIRDSLEKESLTFLSDRKPPSIFEWNQENIFIDIDNLITIENLPKQIINNIIHSSGIDAKTLSNLIDEYK